MFIVTEYAALNYTSAVAFYITSSNAINDRFFRSIRISIMKLYPAKGNHCNHHVIRESPPLFENQIMAWVYIRSITRSTNETKKLDFVSQNWPMEN